MNPFQPRTSFNEEALRELASSIKELGVIQPITVRKLGFNEYQLVSGERRFRASKLIGLETIPAYIRIANDQESLEMALVENIQREDLDPIEIALSYQRLIEDIDLTQEEMSDRVGKNRSTITNYLRLLKLDPIIQTGMRDGFISMGHGRALINVADQNVQLDIYEKIVSDKLSVRETEAMVRGFKSTTGNTSTKKKALPKFAREAQNSLADLLDSKVSIKVSANGKGQLVVPFSSKDDFNRILNKLKVKSKGLYILLFLVSFSSIAQVDKEKRAIDERVIVAQDTVVSTEIYDPLAPSRAAFYSAAIPGLGQAYNKKYWKIPIIYAGMATGVYLYIRNQNDYNRFRDAYKRRLAGYTDDEFFGDGDVAIISNDRLINAQRSAQKNKDYSIITVIAFYALNIIDANVDAHLKQYDISDDLSVGPKFDINTFTAKPNYTLSLTFSFK